MTEAHALGIARCTARVKRGRDGILIEVLEGVRSLSCRKSPLVLARYPSWKVLVLGGVVDQDHLAQRWQLISQRIEQGQEFPVHQCDLGTGMPHRISDLMGGQPHVDRL